MALRIETIMSEIENWYHLLNVVFFNIHVNDSKDILSYMVAVKVVPASENPDTTPASGVAGGRTEGLLT